ncbi:MAG TPA: hypothetical protein P5026_10690 [Kiritimatiellia bacterium]|nr:hypothetical protein [Kiritimatiellia bacterium]
MQQIAEAAGVGDLGRVQAVPAEQVLGVTQAYPSVKKAGHAPDVLGIQNEHAHPAEGLHARVKALRRRLDEAGFRGFAIHSSNLESLSWRNCTINC